MIEVRSLRKHYGDTVAVDDLSFTAAAGRVFGLLGPNGAGKTTTIGCIAGLLPPTSGRITVLGHDVVKAGVDARRQLGVVPQEIALYEELSATANLRYWGGAYGLRGAHLDRRAEEVLRQVGLTDQARVPAGKFSGGMKRRLNFACGIVHEPRVLLLDEPTAGVDPQSRVHILELIRVQADAGTCVLYTTHYMEEAEDLCDELAIVDHGKIIAAGTLPELRALVGERDLLRLSGELDPAAVREAMSRLPDVEVVHADGETVTLAAGGASRRLPELLGALASAGPIRETTLTQPSLETLFIKLTGKELRE